MAVVEGVILICSGDSDRTGMEGWLSDEMLSGDMVSHNVLLTVFGESVSSHVARSSCSLKRWPTMINRPLDWLH